MVVEYKETGNLQQDIAQLAQAPGLEWMAEVASRDDVNWQAVQEVHDAWKKEDSGIGGPGMQLVSLAMAVALSFTPGGQGFATGVLHMATDTAMTAAVAAGFNALVIQAGMQIVGNGGDIGAALTALASIDTVRLLATAMLTAGLGHEALSRFGNTELAQSIDGLAHDLTTGTIQAGINTGVGTAINGGNLGDNLIANLHSTAVSVLGASMAQEIGAAYKGGTGDMDYVAHKIAHAALGGAMDIAMGGDGVSGAIGGVVGEITGEILMNQIAEALLTGQIDPKSLKNWRDAGVDLSKLAAGFAAAAAGGDIDTAANTGGNAARNNAAQACTLIMELEIVAPAILATVTALYLSAKMSTEEFNEALREGAASFKAFIVKKYEALTEEEKQQLDIPGYDATEIRTALVGKPSETDYDGSPISTPDNGGVANSGTVSEDQSGLVDSGVITHDDIASKIASGHAWGKHVDDPTGDLHGEFGSQEEFAAKIKDIITSPDDVKDLENGRKAWWNDASGIVVIYNPNDVDKGTSFKPKNGKKYFDESLK